MSRDFEEWCLRGPGEAMIGGAIKASATNEKRRISKRLAIPNLFPHLEHEDRVTIERLDHAWKEGDRMVKRCQSRTQAINTLLDADAGLLITVDDLKP